LPKRSNRSGRFRKPRGDPPLEINVNEDRGKWLKARVPVVVRKSDEIAELTLPFS